MAHSNVTRTFKISGQAAHMIMCVPLLEVAFVHVPGTCIQYSWKVTFTKCLAHPAHEPMHQVPATAL